MRNTSASTASAALGRPICVLAAAAVLSLTAPAQAQLTSQSGTIVSGPGMITFPLDTMPRQLPARGPVVIHPFHSGTDPVTFAARKSQAARMPISKETQVNGTVPQPGLGAPVIPKNPRETPGSSITIIGGDQTNCFCAPADQAIAVGDAGAPAASIFHAINTSVYTYNKAGNLVSGPTSFDTFGSVTPCCYSTDPRTIYDWINHRYYFLFISAAAYSSSNVWQYNLMVSAGDNPAGSWCVYHIPVQSVAPSGGAFPMPDFPRLGQDRQGIYIASNLYFPNLNTFKWQEIITLPKSSLMTCSAWSGQFFYNQSSGGSALDTIQPANTFNPGDDPRTMYFIQSYNINFGGGQCSSGCNGLVVWGLYGNIGGQTLTGANVATSNNYFLPPNASQPGGGGIDTGDTRVSGSAFYGSGSIYASVNTLISGGTSGCILYEVKPFVNASNGSIASAIIQNEIVQGNSSVGHWYYCTQQPDPEGNVTHVYNFSSASNFVGLAYATRRSAQPTGTLPDGGFFLMGGAANYTFSRWGDYTAVAPAGLVSGGGTGSFPVFWFAGMYANSSGNWQTAIGRNSYTDISQQ
jgi:hypothetical protein